MDLDTSSLVWELLFSSIGIGYFVYGKKQHHKLAMGAGIGLMVYPYFTPSLTALVLIGLMLIAIPVFLKI